MFNRRAFKLSPLTVEEKWVISSSRGLGSVKVLSLITFITGVVALLSTAVNMPKEWAEATVWQFVGFGAVAVLCIVSLFNIMNMLDLREKSR